ncbi:family 78 glycoside hydrolase catalytic domain [Pseudopedobacter beijingensis]|uniref:alpha-L-rhamnosidase n=1 Tax=Pseudopedobacter beijingensis TaxID=1207056 RepID=A0ABW4IE67_9SPHI
MKIFKMNKKMQIKKDCRYRFRYIILLFFLGALQASVNAQSLAVSELTCEYRNNPEGIDVKIPRLSWKLFSKNRNIVQTAYELRVSEDMKSIAKGNNLLWTSGKISSGQSVLVDYGGPELKSRQRYYWQVRVWDNKGNISPWSEVKYWEMGLLSAKEWHAKWIQTAEETNGKPMPSPMFRKEFKAVKQLHRAKLYITSHGLYEARINGKRVGNDYFTPGWTSYHKRLQYQVYDVLPLLKEGNNATLVTLGDGWYRGYLEFNNKRNLYGKELALLYQLELEYADGSKELIVSDNSWKYSFDGPIRFSDIYNGETYDARMENKAVWQPGYNDSKWKNVREADIDKSKLVASNNVPVRKHEVFKPVKYITTPKGEQVIDFGQNLVGWVQIKLQGKAGDSIILHHAEVLDKAGNFYTDNLRGAKQENKYLFKGEGIEAWEPHFTFQGFRYIRIKGYNGKLDSTNVKAFAVYSDMSSTGTFSTSNPLLNQLQHNIQWGQKGNFLDVPTDCPQRDERLGWTGDAQVFFNTAAYNMNVAGFFTKWLQDLKADQLKNGNVPVVIPNVREERYSGTAAWADAATIIPWNFYVAYGDKRLLEEQYDSMKAWVNFIETTSKNNLSTVGSSYGDWLFYTPVDDRYGKGAITDRNLIAQAFYVYSTQLMINAAEVLGKTEDANKYKKLLPLIKEAFAKEYLTPNGRLVSSTQTAYVLALQFDILPENLRKQAAERLVENIKEYNYHLTTGFVGTPYLCHVLTRFGYNDIAYKLLLQETYPSWLFQVKRGATTVWERWDGIKADGTFQNKFMNSFNHYSYGAIGEWMYKTISGIKPDDTNSGYRHFTVAPQPGGALTKADAELETLYGKIRSKWKIENGLFKLEATVPANSMATIILSNTTVSAIKESGKSLLQSLSQENIKEEGNNVIIKVGSGNYAFECTY